ncbi:MAG: hypothetical protein WBC60_03910 [Cognaticolwellia sp.]
MKRVILASIIAGLLSGCASTIGYNFSVGSEESVTKGITYKYDEFQKQGWLSTESYLSDGGGLYTSVTYNYRALYENNKISFIQIYGRMGSEDWCFLDEAFDEQGNEMRFNRIDRDALTGGRVFEDFGLTISKEKLALLAKNKFSFKAVGSKCDVIFTVDKRVSAAFYDSISNR